MRWSSFFVIIIICILLISPSVQAQFSLRPQPLPQSRTFLLTEIGYSYRINSYDEDTFNLKRRHYFTSALGLMTNVNRDYALGGNLFIGMDEGGEFRAGLKVRVRRWLRRSTSIDFSPGLLFWDTRAATENFAFIGSVAVNIRDWFGVTAQLEVVPTHFPGGTDTALYTGLRLGSAPGLIFNTVAMGVAAIFGIIFLFAGGGD